MNVTLRHLRAFVAVAKVGGFTAAGRELNLTQSTLTKSIRELESEVCFQLFERTTRRVQLTNDGSAFLPVAKRLLHDFDLSLEDLREHASGRSGTISIACGTAFATNVLPLVVKRFRDANPGVCMRVLDATSGGVVRQVASGEVDFGFGSMVGELASTLRVKLLLSARLGVLFPPGYEPLPDRITGASLFSLPLLQDDTDSSIVTVLHNQGIDTSRTRPKAVELTNLAMQIAMVRAGVGPCVISALAASHPSAKGLGFKFIEDPAVSRDIYLLSRPEKPFSPAATAFMKALELALPALTLHPGVTVASAVPAKRIASSCCD